MSTKPRQRNHCAVCGAPLPPRRRVYCSREHADRMSHHNLSMQWRQKYSINYFDDDDPALNRDEMLKLQQSMLGSTVRELRDTELRAAYTRVLKRHGLAS